LTPVAVEEAGTATGLFADEAENIALYLVEKDFIKWASIGVVMLTQWGIDEVERALLEPDRATSYFPPVNVMVIGSVSHSQVQQGTSGSSQRMTFGSTERDEINPRPSASQRDYLDRSSVVRAACRRSRQCRYGRGAA